MERRIVEVERRNKMIKYLQEECKKRGEKIVQLKKKVKGLEFARYDAESRANKYKTELENSRR